MYNKCLTRSDAKTAIRYLWQVVTGSQASVKSKKYLWRVAFVMWFNSMARGHQPASKERLSRIVRLMMPEIHRIQYSIYIIAVCVSKYISRNPLTANSYTFIHSV